MGIKYLDGAERGTSKWTSSSNVTIISSVSSPRSGRFAYRFGQTAAQCHKILDTSETTAILAMGLREAHTESSTNCFICFQDEGGTVHVGIRLNNDGSIAVYRGASTASPQIGSTTAPGTLISDQFVQFDIKVVFHDSAGSVEIWIENTSVFSASGVDTLANGNPFKRFRFGNAGGGHDVDDIYLDNTTRHGICKIEGKHVTGAGYSTQWTPNSGTNNWDRVDDGSSGSGATHDSDSTYNSTSTAGHIDSFVTENIVQTAGVVLAVDHGFIARKDDVAVREVRSFLRIGGVNYNDVTRTMLSNFTHYNRIMELSPATGVAFTFSELNGAEQGYECVT